MSNTVEKPTITFIKQDEPIEEHGRALYAICRSVLRALIDSLSDNDLLDLNTPLKDITMRQLAKVVRLERDKGMRGDGFEWAVHEAILGREDTVTQLVHQAMRRCSNTVSDNDPTSIMFGQERAKYLGFLDAVVDDAGKQSYILPKGSGRPFHFGPWVSEAAKGKAAESALPARIEKIWKTDLFLSAISDERHFAATIKSNYGQIEGGPGLRIGIVPESTHKGNKSGVRYDKDTGLWIASLADPNGFMGFFNDGYNAVARAMCTLGKQEKPAYFTKPSAKAERIQEQLEKYPTANVFEIEDALNNAAQVKLVSASTQLVGVNAPEWLHVKEMAPKLIAPKPSFVELD